MNVDTGTFQAITDQLAELAAKVAFLEQREQAYEVLVDAGRESARRQLGFGGDRAAVSPRPRPRHLRALRGEPNGHNPSQ